MAVSISMNLCVCIFMKQCMCGYGHAYVSGGTKMNSLVRCQMNNLVKTPVIRAACSSSNKSKRQC